MLAGSENELKRINLYIANREFIDQLIEYESDDSTFRRLKFIFNMYNCIAVRILQEKECISYIENLITEIPDKIMQTKIALEFKKMSDTILTNDRSRNQQSDKGAKFIIERKTIKYFKITNFQIVNVLNKMQYGYEINSSKNGDLEVFFSRSKNRLNMMEIVLIAVKNGIKLPIRRIGRFVNETKESYGLKEN